MPRTVKASRVHADPTAAPAPRSAASKRPSRRTKLRTEARDLIDGKFGGVTGDPYAGLWYAIEDYAETCVIFYGFKIKGWPDRIPFRNLSSIGGCDVLEDLLALWKSDEIQFVPATDLDKLNAALDPTLVAPGKNFVHRKQSGGRNDIGRSRYRWVTKPDGGPLRRPKDGPKSDKFVRDSDDEDEAQPLRLQPLPLAFPLTAGALGACSSGGPSGSGAEVTEDEISEFSSDDGAAGSEIETVAGWSSEREL